MFNSSFNVYKTEWLDIVFAGRNKNYGAYVLRAQSSSILTKSLFIASCVFVLFFITPFIYGKLFPEKIEATTITKTVELTDVIHSMKKPEPEKKVEPEKTEPIKVKTVAMPSKIVVVDEIDIPEPPTISDIQNAVISDKTQDGEIKPNLVISTNTGKGDGDVNGNDSGTASGNEVIDLPGVDEYPEFEGGMKAWAKYIQRNLRYPFEAQEKGTTGKVFLSFVVEKDGSISNVTLVRGIGSGCDEEAMKVIKKSPAWKPGKNKGTPVRVRYNLPINFTLGN
ncbi:energy transducer TonB [Pedobacter jejuensis]|uniref:Energy transducer TonB n=1 Tax=Pedobacter jejuensis TaxID=1268550 RepID=A0A3N0BW03_9SPHI|nr:energy transducer TonB [Pedobacter jejuensis]RNL53362.1 energy transducer TonB [Pedobacter jejuensis]